MFNSDETKSNNTNCHTSSNPPTDEKLESPSEPRPGRLADDKKKAIEGNTTSPHSDILSLSKSVGGVANTSLEAWSVTFPELCNQFEQIPAVGEKDGSYLVRGPYIEGQSARSDDNIEFASVIILDGDSSFDPEKGEITEGAPDPDEVHAALAEIGITHCLFTTYSHSLEGKGNRYRIVIPAPTRDKGELTGVLEWIFHRLAEQGCYLVNVQENRAWSQAWYFPRLASADCKYLFLCHDAGKAFDTKAALEWFDAQKPIATAAIGKVAKECAPRDPNSVYSRFNAKHGTPKQMLKILKGNGYALQSTSIDDNGNPSYRLLSPHSTSGSAGIVLFKGHDGGWRVFSHHNEREPLSRAGDSTAICDAFDLFRILEHDEDEQLALSAWARESDKRPVIKAKPGNIPETLGNAVQAIASMTPETVYQRGQTLCRVAHLAEASETEGCSIPKGTAQIITLQRAGLAVELSRAARWERQNKDGTWKLCDPPPGIIAAVLEGIGMWGGIANLLGISEAPILRQDGTLFAQPGFDQSTGLYVEGSFPDIQLPENISQQDAVKAAEFLLSPFKEFPFVDERLDQSVVLAYLITLAIRAQLTTAPLFCISATTPGTGKGLIIEACNRLIRGRDAATMPPVQGNAGEEETRKRITALLSRGVASINLDNWTKPIGGESMNTLLTTTEWTDRLLGGSRTISLPNRITMAATGNNLSVRGDTTRRALLLQLDANMEQPERRSFQEKDLLGHIARQRRVLLIALFTILKGFQDAGHPGRCDAPLGRFEQWSAAVSAPIRWLGYPDPVDSQEKLREQDPESDKLELFLSLWFSAYSDKWVTAGLLIDGIEQVNITSIDQDVANPLREAFQEIAPDGRGGVKRQLLGWYLRHNSGRIAAGYKLEPKSRAGKKSKNARQYRVVKLSGTA